MSHIIEHLKKEHMSLVESLKEAHRLGIMNDEGRQKLMSLKDQLLAHMKMEDEELYPPLKKAAENDPDLAASLDSFTLDMAAISERAIHFFEKYSTGGNRMDFLRDYKELLAVLTRRIDREEAVLFGEFFRREL